MCSGAVEVPAGGIILKRSTFDYDLTNESVELLKGKNRRKLCTFGGFCLVSMKRMQARDGAPQSGAARLRRASVFAIGENLGGGEIHLLRASGIPTATIKIATPVRCGYFYGRVG